jgi:hypothetical protein
MQFLTLLILVSIALPWFVIVIIPLAFLIVMLFCAVFSVLVAITIPVRSLFIRSERLGARRLNSIICKFMQINAPHGKACACVGRDADGNLSLAVQIKTSNSTQSFWVYGNTMFDVALATQKALYQKPSCVLRCGVAPCVNCLHCPSNMSISMTAFKKVSIN